MIFTKDEIPDDYNKNNYADPDKFFKIDGSGILKVRENPSDYGIGIKSGNGWNEEVHQGEKLGFTFVKQIQELHVSFGWFNDNERGVVTFLDDKGNQVGGKLVIAGKGDGAVTQLVLKPTNGGFFTKAVFEGANPNVDADGDGVNDGGPATNSFLISEVRAVYKEQSHSQEVTASEDDDFIQAHEGSDKIWAKGGDDVIVYDTEVHNVSWREKVNGQWQNKNETIFEADTIIDGGDGKDTLLVAKGDTIDLSKLNFTDTDVHQFTQNSQGEYVSLSDKDGNDIKKDITYQTTNIEEIDISQNEVNDELNISIKDVLDLTDDNNILKLLGDQGDKAHLDRGWSKSTDQTDGDGFTKYEGYDSGHKVVIEIEDTVTVDIL